MIYTSSPDNFDNRKDQVGSSAQGQPDAVNAFNGSDTSAKTEEVINVIEEKIVIEKEHVETGKIKIRKTVTEETHAVNVPVVNDEYEIVRVDVPHKTLMEPPAPVRQEGDTTIISVIREITVVEKRYEVIEEI